MAIAFSRLWGPSGRQLKRSYIAWTFYAIWQDGTGQRYRLIYDAPTRRFRTSRVTSKEDQHKAAAYAKAMNLGDGAAEVTGRTVTEILRARLSAKDLAKATALSLQVGR